MLSSFHISSCITLAAQEEFAAAQLASPLAYFFISPENFPVPPFLSSVYRTLYHALSDTSSHMHLHAYVLPLSSYTLSSVECFMSIGAGFGNRNALVTDSFKKSTEGHHDDFARVEPDCWVIL
jgi:hypothetical protein